MLNYLDTSLQSQYKGTNIEELLKGIAKIKQKYITTINNSFKEGIDLRTSSGVWLDMWGRLLNFSRFIPVSEESVTLFNNFDFYDKNFIKLKFFNREDVVYSALPDNAYRLVLQMIWASRNIQSNLIEINKLSTEIFESEIVVSDNMDMEFVTYYFRDEIPLWLQHIITKYDILPRPATVGSKFISAIFRYFNFQTNDNEFNRKITAFWNSRFYDTIESEELKAGLNLDNINLDVVYTNKKEFSNFINTLIDNTKPYFQECHKLAGLQTHIKMIEENDNMPNFRAFPLEQLQYIYIKTKEWTFLDKALMINGNINVWLPVPELFNTKFNAIEQLYNPNYIYKACEILEKWGLILAFAKEFKHTTLKKLGAVEYYHEVTQFQTIKDDLANLNNEEREVFVSLYFAYLHKLDIYALRLESFKKDLERLTFKPQLKRRLELKSRTINEEYTEQEPAYTWIDNVETRCSPTDPRFRGTPVYGKNAQEKRKLWLEYAKQGLGTTRSQGHRQIKRLFYTGRIPRNTQTVTKTRSIVEYYLEEVEYWNKYDQQTINDNTLPGDSPNYRVLKTPIYHTTAFAKTRDPSFVGPTQTEIRIKKEEEQKQQEQERLKKEQTNTNNK